MRNSGFGFKSGDFLSSWAFPTRQDAEEELAKFDLCREEIVPVVILSADEAEDVAELHSQSQKATAEFSQQKAATGLMVLERDKLAAKLAEAYALLWKLQPHIDQNQLECDDPETACAFEYFVLEHSATAQQEQPE